MSGMTPPSSPRARHAAPLRGEGYGRGGNQRSAVAARSWELGGRERFSTRGGRGQGPTLGSGRIAKPPGAARVIGAAIRAWRRVAGRGAGMRRKVLTHPRGRDARAPGEALRAAVVGGWSSVVGITPPPGSRDGCPTIGGRTGGRYWGGRELFVLLRSRRGAPAGTRAPCRAPRSTADRRSPAHEARP
jgi:hypothetical protein